MKCSVLFYIHENFTGLEYICFRLAYELGTFIWLIYSYMFYEMFCAFLYTWKLPDFNQLCKLLQYDWSLSYWARILTKARQFLATNASLPNLCKQYTSCKTDHLQVVTIKYEYITCLLILYSWDTSNYDVNIMMSHIDFNKSLTTPQAEPNEKVVNTYWRIMVKIRGNIIFFISVSINFVVSSSLSGEEALWPKCIFT